MTKTWHGNAFRIAGPLLGESITYRGPVIQSMIVVSLNKHLNRHLTAISLILVTWRHIIWSTLVQVMACWLTAPSHYLSQCWLLISESWSECIFTEKAQDIFDMILKLTNVKLQPHLSKPMRLSALTPIQRHWFDPKNPLYFVQCRFYPNPRGLFHQY